jgi:hypothetical protein
MRIGLVQKGNYKTVEYPDLTGYRLVVNDFTYDFGQILNVTRMRIEELWEIECPPGLLEKRLHFSEQRYFNRMMKNEHYGVFHRSSGAHVCLGLVDETDTYNLVIHEIAHEMHYRQGGYNTSDEVVQEAVAIMTEEEYGTRSFDWNPHYTSQQLLHQLKEQPGFDSLPFLEKWDILTQLGTIQQMSYLVNRYVDEGNGGQLRSWFNRRLANPEQARQILNALATATECYAVFNRQLVINRLINQYEGWETLSGSQVEQISRSLFRLRDLDQRYPDEMLTNLMASAFQPV